MKRPLILLAVCILLAHAARAQPAPLLVPCAAISPQAVKTVPAPFDKYMRLICYNTAGQGLEPPAGTHWVNGSIDVALSAMDDRKLTKDHPSLPASPDWYVALTPRTVSPANDAALRHVLAPAIRPLFLEHARLLELDALTSAGELKQEFLLLPADPVATHDIKILIECHEFCQGDDSPWVLGVVPDADE
jgi:hypothetical protein